MYAVAAIMIKVAISRGISSWAIAFLCNLCIGVLYLPLLFFGHSTWSFSTAPMAVLAGVLFFAGQIGTFRSLASGDVSIATPALASKLVFVALMSLLLPGSRSSLDLWIAVVLTMTGVVLLYRGPSHPSSRPLTTAGWAIFAAVCFAATDVLLQGFVDKTGFTLFLPLLFGTVGILSFPLLLPQMQRHQRPLRPHAWFWGGIGLFILVTQSVGVAVAIGLFGDATGVNVVYSSRGLWSLIILALAAKRIGVAESALPRATFVLRVLGSILILAAVIIALR